MQFFDFFENTDASLAPAARFIMPADWIP